MQRSVLLIENDTSLTLVLEQVLVALQCEYQVAHTLHNAYDRLEQFRPELIILDRLLPDGDGIELARYVYDSFFTTRVLCISTLGTTKDRIAGLEIGIDDYLPKPFSLKEFELKVKRLMFSQKVLENSRLQAGPTTLFTNSGVLLYNNVAVQLRKKEAAILACLLRHANTVISRDAIIKYVWLGMADQPTTATLDVYVRRIRAKLGPYADKLKTTRGFGYQYST